MTDWLLNGCQAHIRHTIMGAKKYLKPLTGEQLAQGEPVIIEVNGEKITYMFPKANLLALKGQVGRL